MSSHSRSSVKFIDKVNIGLGSSVAVSFVIIVLAVVMFSFQESLGLALFFGHGAFLFVTGTGFTEKIGKPEPYPEKHFEAGYILGSALAIILVTLAEFSLATYFQAQIAAQFGMF